MLQGNALLSLSDLWARHVEAAGRGARFCLARRDVIRAGERADRASHSLLTLSLSTRGSAGADSTAMNAPKAWGGGSRTTRTPRRHDTADTRDIRVIQEVVV